VKRHEKGRQGPPFFVVHHTSPPAPAHHAPRLREHGASYSRAILDFAREHKFLACSNKNNARPLG